MFYRNINARDLLEIFLISAVTSLLAVRFYLFLTGYPQIGNAHFHVAHMLFGGLLMMVAIVLTLAFLGEKVLKMSSIIGGAGFGIFIDELGKFITRDNNYFYRPTIGIIYAIFMILYLVFNFLGRKEKLTPQESALNALFLLGEPLTSDLNRERRSEILKLIKAMGNESAISVQLAEILKALETVPSKKSQYARFKRTLHKHYQRFWARRKTDRLIGVIFIAAAVVFLVTVFYDLGSSIDSAADYLHSYSGAFGHSMLYGQLASASIAGIFAVIGAFKLTDERNKAYEWFHRSLLTNILLTEFFIFSRIQFAALPGFALNLILLIALRAAQNEEDYLAR